jgi:hypothetical protein
MENLNSNDFIIVKGLGGADTSEADTSEADTSEADTSEADTTVSKNYDKEKHLLTLHCNDYYEGLPEKVVKTFKYIHDNPILFEKYNYICKLDDDMIIKTLLNENELFDYCGNVRHQNGFRNWHIGKCSKGSSFNTSEYSGEFVPWCLGGFGYVVSKKAIEVIKKDTNYFNEIYEDVYIGKILYQNNIIPNSIPNMNKYLYSGDHH